MVSPLLLAGLQPFSTLLYCSLILWNGTFSSCTCQIPTRHGHPTRNHYDHVSVCLYNTVWCLHYICIYTNGQYPCHCHIARLLQSPGIARLEFSSKSTTTWFSPVVFVSVPMDTNCFVHDGDCCLYMGLFMDMDTSTISWEACPCSPRIHTLRREKYSTNERTNDRIIDG